MKAPFDQSPASSPRALTPSRSQRNRWIPALGWGLIVGALLAPPARGGNTIAYVRESNPWGSTVTNTAMDTLYGAGTYDISTFTSIGADFSTFASSYNTVVLQGSDNSGTAFLNFLNSNRSALESWVTAGGRAFMYFGANGVPADSYDLGFGITATYPSSSDYGAVTESLLTTTPDAAPSVMSGGSFGHSTVTTSGVSTGFATLIKGYSDVALTNYIGDVLVGGTVGSGFVVAGGITLPNFWNAIEGTGTPQQALVNILNYAGTSGGTTDLGGSPVTSSSNIDTAQAAYLASDLGASALPVFDGGLLEANTPTVTVDLNLKNTGGTIQAQDGTGSTFSGIIGNDGAEASGSLTITQSGANGSITLSGANTYTGATQVATGATLHLTGSLASTTISVSTGAALDNASGGLATTATLSNAGTVTLGADDTIADFANTGTLNGSNRTLTAASYALNDGSVINANLGTGTLISNGAVSLNGPSAASSVAVQTGTLSLGSAERLAATAAVGIASSAMLSLGGNETIGSLSGAGSVSLGSHTLTVSAGNLSGAMQGTGGLIKLGNDSLALSGANTYEGGTIVRQGELSLTGTGLLSSPVSVEDGARFRADGQVLGSVEVREGGSLGGSGHIGSSVVNRGVTAPGNSPGVLTITGDFTNYGVLTIEADGALGAGVSGGYDQLSVAGQVIIQEGSTLRLARSVAGSFEPAAGQRLRVIEATGGIEGQFSIFDRSAFGTQVLFDLDTGDLVGTGLTQGANNLSLGGVSNNLREIVRGLFADAVTPDDQGQASYLHSASASGALFNRVMQAGATDTALDALSPEAYVGMTDYGLNATRHYSRMAARAPGLVETDGWELAGGYTSYEGGTDRAAGTLNYSVRSQGGYAAVARHFGTRWTIGGFSAVDHGRISAPRMAYNSDGYAMGLHVTRQATAEERLTLSAGYTHGSYDLDGSRNSLLNTLTAETEATADDLWASAHWVAHRATRYSLAAFGELSYTRASVDGFSESAGSDAFVLGKLRDETFIGELGGEISTQITTAWELVGRASYVVNFNDSRREAYARLTNGTTPLRFTHPGFDDNAVRLSAQLSRRIGRAARLSVAYEADLANDSDCSEALNVRLELRF